MTIRQVPTSGVYSTARLQIALERIAELEKFQVWVEDDEGHGGWADNGRALEIIAGLQRRIEDLVLERDRQTLVIRRLVNRESRCEHADDGRHECKHCDEHYPNGQFDGGLKP